MQLYPQKTLIIDGTVSGGPMFAFFNEDALLESLVDFTDFQKGYIQGDALKTTWDSVTVLVPALDVQYFPSAAYDASIVDNFSKYLLDDGVSAAASIMLNEPEVIALYREKLYELKEVLHWFPKAKTCIVAPALLAWIASERVGSEESILHIHQASDQVCMTVFNQGNFTFQKEFHCTNDDEFNYFLIRVLALSDKHASDLKIIISGDMVRGDSWYVRIAKYATQIEFVEIKDMYKMLYADHWRKT